MTEPELLLLSRVAYRGQEISGARLQGLLALLAGDLRIGCGTSRLVEGLWPEEPPQHPAKAVQVLVSRARAQLGADVIARTASGYRLCLRDDQVDASAVLLSASASARDLRGGDPQAALVKAEAGLALWNGNPTGEGAEDPVTALRQERAGTYRSLMRTRAIALARLGRHVEARTPLAELTRAEPRDEEVLLELLRCEAATAGPPAALARYEAYRRSVRAELGTDPGPALQAMHRRLLKGEAPTPKRAGLPHEPNPLLGRDTDIAVVTGLLRLARVTSIVGAGGLGKTRLALTVSRRVEHPIVHFVPLAGVTFDDDVVPEVAAALGVGEARHRGPQPTGGAPTDANTIAAALGTGPALLVLDNCEQVIDGVADLVQALVSKTEELRVLATSRRPLGLSSESVYPLPELDLTTCAELFRQRARAARPGVELPPDAVEELCRHLDGLPLAVELAAARVRAMSVAEIGRRLGDRFALLRGGPRDAPRRHHTLHDVVDWSWGLLAPDGQAAMCLLSVFPGGFTGEAAAAILGGAKELQVLEHLVDQSLLKVDDTPAGTRFRMLETVREFSAARRDEAGRTPAALERFLAWARDFGVAHHEALLGGSPRAVAQRVRAEQDNLVHAMRVGLARADGATVAATSAALATLWLIDGQHERMMTLAGETSWLLSHYRPEPALVPVTRTIATLSTAYTFLIRGPRAVRSLVVLRRLPPPPPDTLLGAAGTVLRAAPDMAADPRLLFALCEDPEPLVAGVASGVASFVWEGRNEPEHALAAARRMRELFTSRPGPWMHIIGHSRVAELCMQVGHGEEARLDLTRALRLMEQVGPWPDVIKVRWSLALVNLHLGDAAEAERWLALAECDGIDPGYGMGAFDSGIRAEIQLTRGDVPAGLRLWRRAVDQAAGDEYSFYRNEATGLEPWVLETQALAVAAHATHGLLEPVEELAASLAGKLRTMLLNPNVHPPSFVVELALCGALLLAVAMAELERNAGDPRARRAAARMIALAERFRFVRNFQPTMAPARVSQVARQADAAAYARAAASYAALHEDELRRTALELLDYLTGSRL